MGDVQMASALQRLLNGLFYFQRGDYWTEPESQQIEFYIFKMAMILVVNKCKPRLKRFTCVESIVFAHLHLNRSKFGTYEFRRF